ncbi:hypothetical protein COV16_01040 [Candidatus Woesearchaeota archaeon CG10_big_fil_rev_8_21_14_0_10_34_8]|nr:MAG: hypothetical protein COV16_01040 [Candidatus Woesearchaeota archaeon CG10_big_fil_rev_8_21_14_0_10_34_8]
MDIDEFLESEGHSIKEGGRNALVEKQSREFITGRSIEQQIQKIHEFIQQKRFNEAEKIYYVVKEHYTTLEKRQQEERRNVHRQLTEINKELIEHLNKVKSDMEQKGMVITDLLMKARDNMQKGNIEKANQLYLEVRRIFKQMPDAFGERKMMLENQILMFYSQLVNEFNRKKYDNLLGKRDEIMRHIEIATNNVRLGHIESAKREYHIINKLYNELPEGFLYEKTIIYKRILVLYQIVEEGKITAAAPMEPILTEQMPKITAAPLHMQKKHVHKKAEEKPENKKAEPKKEKIKEKKKEMDAPPLPI